MSTTEFNALPALLRRKQVMEHLPVGKNKYYDVLAASPDFVVTVPGYTEKRLRKEALRFLVTDEDTQTVTNSPQVSRR